MISGTVLEEVVDFVECWVHSVLYTRKIYPAVLFEQKRYQEISVWQSRHPDINAYIRRVIDNMRPLLEQVHDVALSCRF
jgi:mitotic spindle assembly checkpoint protein MAD2B